MEEQQMREQVLEWIERYKIIAIVRGAEPAQCAAVAEALYEGGIRLMEVTYDQRRPETWQKTAEVIGELSRSYEGKMFVGAGTVTSVDLVDLTAKAGGNFIISPDTDVDVIRKTRELGLVSMPGALTPSEIKTAYKAGADFVKVFPLGEMGPGYLKAIRAPLSHIKMTAVGGINEKNLKDYLEVGACGAGIGGNLANKTWITNGEYGKITATAKELVRIVEEFEKQRNS
jgi:2-dehydro-3-deoxyphosphogluconate aldolase/(4S)-4-hydroxy-2-oxoglutarate aldolase